MIILAAPLGGKRGAYVRGIQTLEKVLLDKRMSLPPEPESQPALTYLKF
jgi:hypothetical protein